eukprot:scaffold253237_cov33-Tisochrysis_lutea.AAC.3
MADAITTSRGKRRAHAICPHPNALEYNPPPLPHHLFPFDFNSTSNGVRSPCTPGVFVIFVAQRPLVPLTSSAAPHVQVACGCGGRGVVVPLWLGR